MTTLPEAAPVPPVTEDEEDGHLACAAPGCMSRAIRACEHVMPAIRAALGLPPTTCGVLGCVRGHPCPIHDSAAHARDLRRLDERDRER